MKAAVATDDLKTVSAHFGMAKHYLVYDIGEGVVRSKEPREKMGRGAHPHAGGHHTEGGVKEMPGLHESMLSNIADCDVVIARGMGRPMYGSIKASGKRVFITQAQSADGAAKALAEGRLDDHPELLH